MLKNSMQLKFNINGKEYLIFCDNDSPTSDMKEMACQVIKMMTQIEDNAKQAAKEKEEKKNEDNSCIPAE